MVEPLPSQVGVNPHFPIEVWEHVLETLYDERYGEVAAALATLSNCALVCRAWRPHAQRVLFHYVILWDKDTLYRFAALVDASPKLGSYVRKLAFRGYLHVPYSAVVLFLTALRGRLSNLEKLLVYEFSDGEKAANPLPEGEKELPCLPFHRYFQSLWTSVSHIRTLTLGRVRFTSFGDFARFLSTLRNLQELHCQRVSWAVHGVEPAYMAKCRSVDSRTAFLPHLKTLFCYDIEEAGRQTLLSGLGPSLRKLHINCPNRPPTLRMEHPDGVKQEAPSLALDLRFFPHLDQLCCALAPFPQPDAQTLETLRDTLMSWMSEGDYELGNVSPFQRYLYLEPWIRGHFTRQQFVELLRTIGPIVEAALCRNETARVNLGDQAGEDTDDRRETDPCLATLVLDDLGDRLEWEEWWRTAMAGCFSLLVRWNRLEIYPTHTRLPNQKWRDYDETPQDYGRRRRKQYAMDEVFDSSRGRPNLTGRRRASF